MSTKRGPGGPVFYFRIVLVAIAAAVGGQYAIDTAFAVPVARDTPVVSAPHDSTAGKVVPDSTLKTTQPEAASRPVVPIQPVVKTVATAVPMRAYACQVAPYASAVAPSPASSPLGMTRIIDNPVYYSVDGSVTTSQAIQNILNCAAQQPALGGYQAITSYASNWSYGVVSTGSDVCRLTAVKVTVRTSQLLPSYVGSSQNSTLQAKLATLYAHEAEHSALSVRYADTLYTDLVALRAPCGSIRQQATALTSAMARNLRSAHTQFDSHTQHGTL